MLPLERVRVVAAPVDYSRLPRQPSWLRGLANVGGEVVPVLDLAAWQNQAAAPQAERIVVVQADGERFGLLVDEVLGVTGLGDDTLEYGSFDIFDIEVVCQEIEGKLARLGKLTSG